MAPAARPATGPRTDTASEPATETGAEDPRFPGPDAVALDAQVDRAVVLFHEGRPLQASKLLREVRRRATNLAQDGPARAVVARAWMSESAPHFDVTGDLDAALAMLQRAEEIAQDARLPALLAKVAGQRALVVLRSGETRSARAAFDKAAALLDAAEPPDQALILINRGVLHLEHADLVRAEADLTRAVGFARRADDPLLTAMARQNLGYVDFLYGRIPRALAAMEEAAKAFPDGPHPVTRLDFARVLREAGLLRDADAVLAVAATEAKAARLFQDLAEIQLVRAECALAGEDPGRARTLGVAARGRFARRGNLRWQRKAELLVLRCERAAVDERGARGRRTALAGIAERAEGLALACRGEGREDLAGSADLIAAECRLGAGQAPAAEPPRLRVGDRLQTRLLTREVRALSALRAGDPARATAEVRHGLDELGTYQNGLGSLDLRTAGALHGVALARLGLRIAVGSGRPARVLALVERARSISSRLPQVSPPSDEVTARLLGELRQAEEEARGLEGDPSASDAVARLRSRAAALQRDIRARAWELEGDDGADVLRAPRLAHVREAAGRAGSTFVTFAQHEGTWLAVVVHPTGCSLTSLARVDEVHGLVRRLRADLDAAAMPRLPAPLLASVHSSVNACLRRLDALLLGPLRVAGEALVLSCSGALAVLPWGLLPSRSGLPTVVTPGASAWLRSNRGEPRPARPRAVALAGPDLRAAEQEARQVASTWPSGELHVGKSASTLSVRTALRQADVLHVAAHGTHRHDSPLFSSVRLADGPLYAYELDAHAGIAPAVTLSACEAGLATLRPGDEGLGLTHVLLHLGVRSVVAGVARVRDDIAADTMERVHRGMAAGTDTAAALAAAQRDVRDERGESAPPAPFVCFGGTW